MPFEAIVRNARPWGVMTAYNSVNGTTMTEHHHLVEEVLRGAWGFDGVNVSDWTAARDTVGAANGGLDIAMPGPRTVYGPALARAVREGRAAEAAVELPRRAFEVWDDTTNAWAYVKGSYEISAGRSITDRRLTAPINV